MSWRGLIFLWMCQQHGDDFQQVSWIMSEPWPTVPPQVLTGSWMRTSASIQFGYDFPDQLKMPWSRFDLAISFFEQTLRKRHHSSRFGVT
jgi:hypothetical protein